MKRSSIAIALLFFLTPLLHAQEAPDWFKTGINQGVEKVRMAVADFKAAGDASPLAQPFNDTLWNDLESAGLFDMVSKSFYPLQVPGTPPEYTAPAWGNPPPNAAMLAFGNLNSAGQKLTVQGWLYDVKNPQVPQVLGKQYVEAATPDGARTAAHKFADDIIFRLGGGIPGIAESKIVFISARSGHKEVWEMDYDGANQHQLTHLNSIALGPKLAPDGSRVAFSELAGANWEIRMYSLVLGRMVSFPRLGGMNISPAWSPDGLRLAFSSSVSGHPEIYVINADGGGRKRLTTDRDTDVSPVFNPKTGAQIAFVRRTGLYPQLYVMAADGTNPQRLTDQGYAVSPSWSPNGQFLAFSWLRHYGPGAPGARDIYVMDIASRQWVQLTHDGGANDFPSWSPDGRHLVFQSNRSGSEQIWSMLADGSQQKQLTISGRNSQPNWSFK